MTKPLKLERVSYVIRVWVEFLHKEPPQFRGEIEHAESKQRKYFSKVEDIQDFIEGSAGQHNQQD